MKILKFTVLLISALTFFYCNSPTNENGKNSDEVLNDTTIYETGSSVSGSFETPVEQSQTTTNSNTEPVSNINGEPKPKPKTSEDIDELIKAGVNTDKNPDNYSGSWDEELDKNKYVPIISEADKKLYRVQIFVSPNKLPNGKLKKEYTFLDTIYVVYHDGLYKYCVGKFDTKEDAEKHAIFLSDYGINDYKVTNYSSAW